MSDAVRIDLHGHSTFSDGLRSPAQIAALCAMRAVRFAALTDHNNIDGQDAFEMACERNGIGYISGLELHVLLGYRDVHLLCYGFNRNGRDLCRALADLKASRSGTGSAYAVVPQPDPGALISTMHRAGGVVLLAHPLTTEPDRARLEQLLDDLLALGMDGIEVRHPQANEDDQHFLNTIASQRGCIVSAGTDHHGRSDSPEPALGVDVDLDTWRSFRDRLTQRRKAMPHHATATETVTDGRRNGRVFRRMLMPMVLPALAVITLFTLALFGFFLPAFEKALLERKRETIRELTRTIWSMLDEAEKQVQSGRLTPEAAREQAVERVRGLRYGREGLDYFWIQDLSPQMIMHPYRPDLEGRDLSGFRDPLGSPIFNLFADKVRQDGAGYVDYVWQWKDNPDRMEAKESYIKLFEPWGWVIGTGLYMNDVRAEIRNLELRIYHVMLAITAALILLLLSMLRGGLKSERLRFSAEQRLHESNARYASLVKAASEGVLFVRNRRCVYANPVFLELAGCDADELALLDWQELFPETEPWEPPPTQPQGSAAVHRTTTLRRRDGHSVACRLSLKGMPEGGGTGSFVVLVRRADEPVRALQAADESLLKRLLNLPAATADDLARQIAMTTTAEAVIECCQRTHELVRAMLDSSAAPTAIAAMLASITDAATVKFIELTQKKIGPEPVPFAFVVVGSQGRQEQTLYTDQDNIVIYESPPSDSPHPPVANYFKILSESVCALLVQAGYRECKGQLMASNAKWRNSLDDWFLKFSSWIGKAEGHEAMDFMTLFDMRCVHGQANLVKTLRNHIDREIEKAPWFFTQAARNAVQFKTPLRIFGTIVTAGRASEKSGHLDLKAAMMPIVCYARLYALKHQLHNTATPERLSSLCDQGLLLPSLYHDIITAFETLMRLRLRHQSDIMRNGGEPDNLIRLAQLGHIDEAILKECFHDIDRIQDRIGKEFLGGEPGNQ